MFEEEAAQHGLRERRLRPDGAIAAITPTGRRRSRVTAALGERRERMDPTASIRKLGFRKWYERELIESHAALVTCLLCGPHARRDDGEIAAALRLDVRSRCSASRSAPVAHRLALVAALHHRARARRALRRELELPVVQGVRALRGPRDRAWTRCPGRPREAVAPLEAAWLRVRCKHVRDRVADAGVAVELVTLPRCMAQGMTSVASMLLARAARACRADAAPRRDLPLQVARAAR